MRTILIGILLMGWMTAWSQQPTSDTPPPSPVLSREQKLEIQNLIQKLEIAQLKAQAAQRDFEAAKEELSRITMSLRKEGWELNLETLEYRKAELKKE